MANGLSVNRSRTFNSAAWRLSIPGISLFAVLALPCLTGCRPPPTRISMRGTSGPWNSQIIGHSVEKRPIEMLSAGSSGETILILATIHGDEAAGTPLLLRLADEIASRSDVLTNRRILLIPIANPDGYVRQIRHNVHRVDLNRNFPADNYQTSNRHGDSALSEPESRALHQVLTSHRPSRIISIHQPLICLDYDGPALELASAMAAHCDLPVKKLGGRPGSLGSYAGETLGIPIITVELAGEDSGFDANTLWNKYGRMLLAGIYYPQPAS